MMTWLMENITTIIISILLLLWVIVVIRKLIKNPQGCGGQCGSCKSCHHEPSHLSLMEAYRQDHPKKSMNK